LNELPYGRPRKHYRLTRKGKQKLAHHRGQWEALSVAMGKLGVLASEA